MNNCIKTSFSTQDTSNYIKYYHIFNYIYSACTLKSYLSERKKPNYTIFLKKSQQTATLKISGIL